MPRVLVKGEHAAVQLDFLTQRHDHLGRALAIEPALAPLLDDDRHAAAITVEGNLPDDMKSIGRRPTGEFLERHFHRVAEPKRLSVAILLLQAMAARGIAQQVSNPATLDR